MKQVHERIEAQGAVYMQNLQTVADLGNQNILTISNQTKSFAQEAQKVGQVIMKIVSVAKKRSGWRR